MCRQCSFVGPNLAHRMRAPSDHMVPPRAVSHVPGRVLHTMLAGPVERICGIGAAAWAADAGDNGKRAPWRVTVSGVVAYQHAGGGTGELTVAVRSVMAR